MFLSFFCDLNLKTFLNFFLEVLLVLTMFRLRTRLFSSVSRNKKTAMLNLQNVPCSSGINCPVRPQF